MTVPEGGGVDPVADGVLVGELEGLVAVHPTAPFGDELDGPFRALGFEIAPHDNGAFGGESERSGPALPAAGAGNQSDLSGQPARGLPGHQAG
jgi:hypothetical protein